MLRTQIYLSEAERQGLQALALRCGRSQSALIREAIDAFLQQHQPQGRLAKNLPTRFQLDSKCLVKPLY